MTTATIAVPFHGLGSWRNRDAASGVSEAALTILNTLRVLREHLSVSATLRPRLVDPYEKLMGLLEDVSVDEETISTETVAEAFGVLANIPASVPSPEIMAEPSGAIAFEWYKDPEHVFVISVNGNRSMEYAALLGEGNELHGRVIFSEIIPAPIRANLQLFLSGN